MKNRLFTFGCSYTFYMWPTWADFLGIEYDQYENWAFAGLGNRAIFERLIECHACNNLTKHDTVIIQWSSHLRYDWHSEKFLTGKWNGWQTNGNVFSGTNGFYYDQRWYDRFFSERSWIMHTLNFILSAKNILENIGCQWFMTSMGDIRYLGHDLDDTTKIYEKVIPKRLSREFPLWDQFSEFACYKEAIDFDSKKWITPINTFALENKDLYWYFQADHDPKPWKESHPSPLQHQKWLNECLRPRLGLSDSIPERQISAVQELIDLKSQKIFLDSLKFEHFLLEESKSTAILEDLHVWPNKRQGL